MRFIPSAVTSKVARQILVGQKHSPTILFVGGVAGVVATTVMACRATLRLDDEVLVPAQKDVGRIKEAVTTERYTEKDRKRDMLVVYVQAAGRITKLYGPTVLVGAASIAALTGSHNILTKRNAGLTAAYAAIEKSFREYRERVVKEYGEKKDRDFYHGTQEVVEVTEDKNGPKKIKHKGSAGGSMYAKFFDENNKHYKQHPDYNIMFLRQQQNWLNDRLQARGHVFLNEAYEQLGYEDTTAGAVVGWIKDSEHGDHFIDFGIWEDENRDGLTDFVRGVEGGIWLDFNVDGIIHTKI